MSTEIKPIQSPSSDPSLNPLLPEQIQEQLTTLIDYLWNDELTSFRAAVADSSAADNSVQPFRDHIFIQLVSILSWLEGRHLEPESYLEDREP